MEKNQAILEALLSLFVNDDEDVMDVAHIADCSPNDVYNLMRELKLASPERRDAC